MGFDVLGWLDISDTDTTHYGGHTIARTDLRRIIEEGIQRCSILPEGLKQSLRNVGETTDYITIGTWGVKTDIPDRPQCGCPLTEAGLLDINPANPLALEKNSGGTDKYSNFFGYFDKTAPEYVKDAYGRSAPSARVVKVV